MVSVTKTDCTSDMQRSEAAEEIDSSNEVRVSSIDLNPKSPDCEGDFVDHNQWHIRKCGFEVGDMVWVKVKSHPWWPGHVYSELFASPAVRRTKRDGCVLVAFFGDGSYGWFDVSELISFDINFTEKSKQLSSRSFLKAVEEATYEISRRCFLALACSCRSLYCFRSTNVNDYLEVDLPGYEPKALYSISRIGKVRDSFNTSEMLSFLKKLGLGFRDCEKTNLEFVKIRATVSAYRKAVFEEFDETYAQAFGVTYVEHSHEVGADKDKESPQAPSSGSLVIPGTLSGGRSSKKASKVKGQSVSKLEARSSDSHAAYVGESLPSESIECVLSIDSTSVHCGTHEVDADAKLSVKGFSASTEGTSNDIDNPVKIIGNGKIKKRKPLKPPSGNLSAKSSTLEERKKKRKKVVATPIPLLTVSYQQKDDEPSNSDSSIGIELELQQLLISLKSLALDPFQSLGSSIHHTVGQSFLRFRSIAYEKSSALSSPTENESFENLAETLPCVRVSDIPAIPASENNSTKLLSPVKPSIRHEDPTNSGRKRLPSDRQEEIKRKSKFQQKAVKAISSVKKIETAAKPINPTPTVLVMKFPNGTSLPSHAFLKARFARFGPIDHDAMRVFWKTFTCRVVFLHKLDAEAAYKYAVGNKSLFSNVGVKYLIREVGGLLPEDDNTSMSMLRVKDQNSHASLKSCLKKRNGDDKDNDGGRKLRVKFVMDGEENSKKIENIVCSSSILAIPDEYEKSLPGNTNHIDSQTRNFHNTNSSTYETTDISQQMQSLLTKCSDVVNHMQGVLGYVPYHPL